MTEVASDYLDEILVSRTTRARIRELQEQLSRLFPGDTVEDILLTDYVNDDGVRQFENLWFFTARSIHEARLFQEQDDIDWLPRPVSAQYSHFESQNYDFDAATDASRLKAYVAIGTTFNVTMKASGRNCDYMLQVLRTYVLPVEGSGVHVVDGPEPA